MQISKPDRNVIDLLYKCKIGDKIKAYLMSDIHDDSIKCDRQMFLKHLGMAEEDKAVVIINGDLLDAMQGRDDPRRSPEELRQEYNVSSYTDALVIDVAKRLKKFRVPYIIGLGNHEAAVLKHMGTNLIDRIVKDINDNGGEAYSMGYFGFARFRFHYAKGGVRYSKLMYWHHGKGGNSPVTKGVIDTARMATYLDADIVWAAHNHQSYDLPINCISVNTAGKIVESNQHHVRTPGYKIGGIMAGDQTGFDIEKCPMPTARGCNVLSFIFNKTGVEVRTQAILY